MKIKNTKDKKMSFQDSRWISAVAAAAAATDLHNYI